MTKNSQILREMSRHIPANWDVMAVEISAMKSRSWLRNMLHTSWFTRSSLNNAVIESLRGHINQLVYLKFTIFPSVCVQIWGSARLSSSPAAKTSTKLYNVVDLKLLLVLSHQVHVVADMRWIVLALHIQVVKILTKCCPTGGRKE